MLKIIDGKLTENEYCIENDGKHAAIFTTGNGYMGIRGSFEEFGSIRVQGAYVRGFIGSITEVFEPFPDNEYMKNYYFDEDKLKDFEKQDSIVNISDFLFVRVFVDGVPFYPWKNKIISWNRSLDPKTGILFREVVWDNGKGDVTKFTFTRFASYEDKHKYCLKVTVSPINHNKIIRVASGIDTKVKTCGQKIISEISRKINHVVLQHIQVDNLFGFQAGIGASNKFYVDDNPIECISEDDSGIIANVAETALDIGKELVIEKTVLVWTSREDNDMTAAIQRINEGCLTAPRFANQLKAHLNVYEKAFEKLDVKIEGDENADGLLRYANFQTFISACDDSVHSLSAKGLTGEKYNNFVWWDCEIYQLPIFIYTYPEMAKQALLYRYKLLGQSKINAQKDGLDGAKYAFCSSVTGEERVWIYARHPFLQIHINADIAFSVINYFRVTGDEEFLINQGVEMLCEIARYWIKRCTLTDGQYQLNNVTGTDEHHPYVDNDAYTNYLVQFTLKKTLEYLRRFKGSVGAKPFMLNSSEKIKIADIVENLYLPIMQNNLIPQFDGYFNLSRTLPITNGRTAKSFQMKQSGLYHLSQVIKQPDVVLLFNYICREEDKFTPEQYKINWDYYEKLCESASSLSFPVHAIASADNGRMLSFYDYFMNTMKIDIDDLHNCAWQGVHSACIAGGWLAVYRGLFGIDMLEDAIHMNPNFMPFWSKVTINFQYKGERIFAEMNGRNITLSKESDVKIQLVYKGEPKVFSEKTIELKI